MFKSSLRLKIQRYDFCVFGHTDSRIWNGGLQVASLRPGCAEAQVTKRLSQPNFPKGLPRGNVLDHHTSDEVGVQNGHTGQ